MKKATQNLPCGQKQDRPRRKTYALADAAVVAFLVVTAALTMGARGTMIIDLGTAGNFTILTKAGITTTAGTSIVGDIGVSPIAATGITGFGLILDPSGQFSTSSLVTGNVFAANYAVPTPSILGTAIGDMETAYTDAAGRTGPDFLNVAGGNLMGQTLAPGLYKWASAVTITDSITLDGLGDPNAVWVFQIDNRLSLASGARITLSGGAMAGNVFWQSVEGATLGTTSHFEGILLTAADITVQTDASVNGNLYAQTAVTLDRNAIVQVVPEPATWALLLVGLGSAVLVRRTCAGSRK